MLIDSDPDCIVVIHHPGGAKGKAVLDAVRTATPAEIGCAKLTRAEERQNFLRREIRRFRGQITVDGSRVGVMRWVVVTCARSRR
jgi:DNA polymerase III subunit delta